MKKGNGGYLADIKQEQFEQLFLKWILRRQVVENILYLNKNLSILKLMVKD